MVRLPGIDADMPESPDDAGGRSAVRARGNGRAGMGGQGLRSLPPQRFGNRPVNLSVVLFTADPRLRLYGRPPPRAAPGRLRRGRATAVRAGPRGGPGAEAFVRQPAWRGVHRRVPAARPAASPADHRTRSGR